MPPVAPRLDIRRLAARVLGDIAVVDVALELALVLKDDDRDVLLAAADSLARIGERLAKLPNAAMESLLAALPGADRDLRLCIIRALAWGDHDRILEVLEAHLGDEDSFVRAEAVRALSKRGSNSGFGDLLGDPDPGVRLAVARAVAGAKGPKAVDPLAGRGRRPSKRAFPKRSRRRKTIEKLAGSNRGPGRIEQIRSAQ
jgi:HEAT repeat protein